MLIVFVVGLLAGARCEDRAVPQECKPGLLTHYVEMGCTPVFGTGPCPIKYDCPPVQSRSKDKCYFRGTQYERGASIGTFYSACAADCRCQDLSDSANILCASIECADIFNPEHRRPDCVQQYGFDSCCFESQFCPNSTKNTTDITCQYNGRTLMEGERFEPIEDPCQQCICKEGFDGTLKEPWCRKIECGTELHRGQNIRDGCAPVYYTGCCPSLYRCPEAGDQVQVSSEDSGRTSDDKCTFGSLEMNIGDKLNQGSDNCIECTCKVPPLPICENICKPRSD